MKDMASYSSSSPPPRPGAMIQVSIFFLTFFVLSANTYQTNFSSADDHTALLHSYPTNKTDHPNPNGKKPPHKRSPPPPSPPPPPPPSPPPPPPPPPPFDYYILELIWPPSFCRRLTDGPPCRYPLLQRWTIHGLWPQGHVYCNPGDKLQPGEIISLITQLGSEWPSLTTTSNDKFWGHQWLKHGTCSGLRQKEYFELTLNLFKKLGSVRQNVGTAGCNPGNKKCKPSEVATNYPGARIKCYDRTSTPHVEMMGAIQFKFYKNETRDSMVEPTNCTSTYVEYLLKYTTTQLIG